MSRAFKRRSDTPAAGLTAGVLGLGGLAVLVVAVTIIRFGWIAVAMSVLVLALLGVEIWLHVRRSRARRAGQIGSVVPTCLVCRREFDPADGTFPLPAGRSGEVVHVHDGQCLRTAAERWARQMVDEFGVVPAVAAATLLGEAARQPNFQSVYAAVNRLATESAGGGRRG
ncbi:hypothetical protein DMH04_41440 [Kibdelosporangium aridum]|uniref:Uncharacterized protein n=1 Tax=Kibdelosporangium aridum TaxID=2030 RepID=A0A428YUU6_KIBAR|nr:hypothetical protein [Kibdelosporangium aridum]RSM73478.1 hypothetical protein DMH04_41440 [Kibdelosporangium aridum]